MLVSDGYAPQRIKHALLHGPTAAPLVIEFLQPPVSHEKYIAYGEFYARFNAYSLHY